MQSVQWSLAERETPQRQIIKPARPAVSAPEKPAAGEKEQSDRQAAAESTYAAFVWLFGPGCI